MARLPVEDRLAIQDLMSAYSWALDTGDPEALAALFTEDAQVIEQVFEDPDVWDGRAGVAAMGRHYANSKGFPGRQHHVTMPVFTAAGPDAVHVKAFAFVTECHGEPPMVLRFSGHYEDEVVRDTDGEWRFRRRTIRLWDGEVLKNFPGHGDYVPRKRPPELMLQK